MRVLLLAGGDSNERAISFKSSAAVYEALKRLGHDIKALDPGSGQELLYCDGEFLPISAPSGGETESEVSPAEALIRTLQHPALRQADIVFLGLHGGRGENGSIQNLLQIAGAKYTGSNMTASAAAMDKAMAKRLMAAAGVRTPQWALCRLDEESDMPEIAGQIMHNFEFPLIVKPNDSGSTVGLTKVDRPDHLARALQLASEHSRDILIEKYINGREMTVSVFDGQAYPVVEIRPTNELYDYEAKYTKGKSQYLAPAPIDDSIREQLQADAIRVYEAIGNEGLARIDFILDRQMESYCLELNTLPGMTSLSLSPMAFKAEGIDFDGLVAMIIEAGLRRRL
jgi:D-alanine-D-alanine ligase